MSKTVNVTIPLDAEAAQALASPVRRQAVGRYLSELLKRGGVGHVLADAIADAKREAHANRLTDADVDAEVEAWRAGR